MFIFGILALFCALLRSHNFPSFDDSFSFETSVSRDYVNHFKPQSKRNSGYSIQNNQNSLPSPSHLTTHPNRPPFKFNIKNYSPTTQIFVDSNLGTNNASCGPTNQPCLSLDYAISNRYPAAGNVLTLRGKHLLDQINITTNEDIYIQSDGYDSSSSSIGSVSSAAIIECAGSVSMNTSSLLNFNITGNTSTASQNLSISISGIKFQNCPCRFVEIMILNEADNFPLWSHLEIAHNTFSNGSSYSSYDTCYSANTPKAGGAICVQIRNSDIAFSNYSYNSFTQNTAGSYGGALSHFEGQTNLTSPAAAAVFVIMSNSFFQNVASFGGGGSRIYFDRTYVDDLTFSNNKFEANRIEEKFGAGGGVSLIAIASSYNSWLIDSNSFTGNLGTGTGAAMNIKCIYNYLFQLVVSNNLFYRNAGLTDLNSDWYPENFSYDSMSTNTGHAGALGLLTVSTFLTNTSSFGNEFIQNAHPNVGGAMGIIAGADSTDFVGTNIFYSFNDNFENNFGGLGGGLCIATFTDSVTNCSYLPVTTNLSEAQSLLGGFDCFNESIPFNTTFGDYCCQLAPHNSSLTSYIDFSNSVFTENVARVFGGGITIFSDLFTDPSYFAPTEILLPVDSICTSTNASFHRNLASDAPPFSFPFDRAIYYNKYPKDRNIDDSYFHPQLEISDIGGAGGGLGLSTRQYLATGSTIYMTSWDADYSNNSAGANGGAVRVDGLSNFFINQSKIQNNAAPSGGGAFFFSGLVSIESFDTIISDNKSPFGSILYSTAPGSVKFSTSSPKNFDSEIGSAEAIRDYKYSFKPTDSGNVIQVIQASTLHWNVPLLCPPGQVLTGTSRRFSQNPVAFSDKLSKQYLFFSDYSCEKCPTGNFSLHSGFGLAGVSSSTTGSKSSDIGFSITNPECLRCGFGGICTGGDLVAARPSYWGYEVSKSSKNDVNCQTESPGDLCFATCPPNYCCTLDTPEENQLSGCFPYDGCSGNRTGQLCGTCRKGFSESVSQQSFCVASDKCGDGLQIFIYILLLCLPALVILVYFLKNPEQGGSGLFKIFSFFFQIVALVSPPIASTWFQSKDSSSDSNNSLLTVFAQAMNLGSLTSLTDGSLCPWTDLDTIGKLSLRGYLEPIVPIIFLFLFFVGSLIWERFVKKESFRQKSKTLVASLSASDDSSAESSLSIHPGTNLDVNALQIYAEYQPHYSELTIVTLVLLILLSYTPMALVSLIMISCKSIRDSSFMFYAGNIECFTVGQGFILAFLIIWIFPFPLYLNFFRKWLRNKQQKLYPTEARMYKAKNYDRLLQQHRIELSNMKQSDSKDPSKSKVSDNRLNAISPKIAARGLQNPLQTAILENKKAALQILQTNEKATPLTTFWTLKILIETIEGAYKPMIHWWETVVLFRRLLLVAVFSLVFDSFSRAFLLSLVCLLILLAHLVFWPFHSTQVNITEAISLFFLVFLSLVNIRYGTMVSLGVRDASPVQLDTTTTFSAFIFLIDLGVVLMLSYAVFVTVKPLIIKFIDNRRNAEFDPNYDPFSNTTKEPSKMSKFFRRCIDWFNEHRSGDSEIEKYYNSVEQQQQNGQAPSESPSPSIEMQPSTSSELDQKYSVPSNST